MPSNHSVNHISTNHIREECMTKVSIYKQLEDLWQSKAHWREQNPSWATQNIRCRRSRQCPRMIAVLIGNSLYTYFYSQFLLKSSLTTAEPEPRTSIASKRSRRRAVFILVFSCLIFNLVELCQWSVTGNPSASPEFTPFGLSVCTYYLKKSHFFDWNCSWLKPNLNWNQKSLP